jgi:glucose/arabinose dehydrogenase
MLHQYLAGRALVSVGLLLAACAAYAQAPSPATDGRPPELSNSPLAPNPPALMAKSADDISVSKIKLPPGFAIELWASGLPNARSIAVGSKGTVFVGTRLVGSVYAVVDRGDHREVKTIITGLHRPNGVAFRDGSLFVAEISRVLRYDDIESRLDHPPAPVVVSTDLPKDEPHGWRFIRFGPDGWLYVGIGAPCNICNPPATNAQIRRIRPDGSAAEVYARGVRNTVGFDWDPQSAQLWFTDNGRDWLGDDLPSDELNHAAGPGLNFGYPFCHQGDTPDPEFGRLGTCADAVPPVVKLGAHVASLGMRFYTGSMFPPEYRNRIFIAEHGSWNRSKKVGYRVVSVDVSRQPAKSEVFAEGWLDAQSYWGRPVDVQVMADGSLLVSDDEAGALYRITYKR